MKQYKAITPSAVESSHKCFNCGNQIAAGKNYILFVKRIFCGLLCARSYDLDVVSITE